VGGALILIFVGVGGALILIFVEGEFIYAA
jgi:hypothetical protein